MEDQYGGMADLRQYLSSSNSSSRPLYPPIIPPQDLLSSHRGLAPHPYVDMLVFRHEPKTSAAAPTSNNTGGGGLMEASGGIISNGDGTGTGRWPRQETLTLLEIRSRLDPKFKEANQKGPLWDEVSRIMSEEHGYQRSGKKCREKFENLYKYYKKTKEGKAGRQDGKHYRFFRQLEALYGETNSNTNAVSLISESHIDFRYNFANKNPSSLAPNQDNFQCPKLSDTSLSLSNYSDYETSDSTDDSDLNEGLDSSDLKEKKRRGRKRWKVKIRDFIDAQMKKLMDKQEAWMDKMVRTIEHKERERMIREEEWRKQDAARIEREHKFWASERAWIEARDAALMDALHKITSKETTVSPPMAVEISENQNDDGSETMTNSGKGDIWPEEEINRLIQLRTAMEVKFRTRTSVSDEAVLWEEISNKMTCFGHERSALVCKEKWDSVNNYLLKCNKKIRKETPSKGCTYYQNHDQAATISYCGTSDQQPRVDLDHHHNNNNHTIMRLNDNGNSSPNHNDNNSNNAGNNNSISDNCFRYFMGDAYGRIID